MPHYPHAPDGHPKSPTCGHLKIPHPSDINGALKIAPNGDRTYNLPFLKMGARKDERFEAASASNDKNTT